jgi:leucyl-tRNA synthetase
MIERKWQDYWEKSKAFKVEPNSKKEKYYLLEMLPYPSGHLHMGHARNYAIGDVVARYKIMKGYNVLHPMGWDAFGMPAENAAIKHKVHPAEWTYSNIEQMKEQFRKLGFSYDWSRETATCAPEYYKWEQLVFLKMFEEGLVERRESFINWCDHCQTVLANEQVVQGTCWRCDQGVQQKSMTQWYFKISKYAEELLKDIDKLDGWPDRVKTMQRDWIGRSEGTLIKFPLEDSSNTETQNVEVFTTRPDTLYGATFMSLASEHPLARKLAKGTEHEKVVEEFITEVAHMDRMKRLEGDYEKKGVFTGKYCINPVTGSKMPIYIANFVLMDYGTGAVMAVPAHDQRDFEFAKKYDLPLKVVIQPEHKSLKEDELTEAYTEEGVLVHSDQFDGLNNIEAIEKITKFLTKEGKGEETVNYRLKDWCVSRQRYWGAPIPIIYCDACGVVPVSEKDLPVELPHDVEFSGIGGSPLAKVEEFVNTTCPKCKAAAKRETDTLDTFVESSWYFLRYCSPKYDKGIVDVAEAKYWMPVDHYIGGIEHAVGHLMYCRFYMKVLRDLGFIKYSDTNEPATNLLTQGMVIKDGAKMSKSKGNVVSVDDMVDKYGADTARVFSLFAAPPEKDLDWSDQGVEGGFRFLSRVWRLVYSWSEATGKEKSGDASIDKVMHKTIKKVTGDIERFHFNTAIAAIMEYVNALYRVDVAKLSAENITNLVLLIAPFAPHMAEEVWSGLSKKGDIYHQSWPVWDKDQVVDEEILVVVQVNGKLRDKLSVPADIAEDEIKKMATESEKVAQFVEGKEIRKVVYVPKRLVNIVV